MTASTALPGRLRHRSSRALTSRSGRGRWQRVLDAREQARLALGGSYRRVEEPPKRSTVPQDIRKRWPPPNVPVVSEVVLSVGEAASQLLISRDELERMIAAGKVRALPTGFTQMIPVSEIEKLRV